MHNHIEVCEFLRNASANVHAMDYTGMQVYTFFSIPRSQLIMLIIQDPNSQGLGTYFDPTRQLSSA